MTDSDEKEIKLTGKWAFLILSAKLLAGLATLVNWFVVFALLFSLAAGNEAGKFEGILMLVFAGCCFLYAYEKAVTNAALKKLDNGEFEA
jgi:formate/nitrite transporter FocA (FNT family)